MKSDLISRTELLVLPEITLILFCLLFLGAVFWIFRPGAREAYAERSLMPLDDERPDKPGAHIPHAPQEASHVRSH